VPEHTDDQGTPIDEPYYPPIRGGGPGNGFAHIHDGDGSGGTGPLIPTSTAPLTIDEHTHPEHGTALADWTSSHNFGHRYQHFHVRDGLGQAVWTGPKYPQELHDDAQNLDDPPEGRARSGGGR
jgi:hypothetical protein